MAKKKNNRIWWVLGGLGVGWLIYRQMQSSAGTPSPAPLQASLPPATTALPVGTPAALPVDTTIRQPPSPPPGSATPSTAVTIVNPTGSPVSANPVTLSSSIGPIGPGETTDAGVPYDPRMGTLQTWAVTNLDPCDLGRWNLSQTNFTAAEWSGLYDIYFNDWIGGQGITEARKEFWDDWRKKYLILTNTPCS